MINFLNKYIAAFYMKYVIKFLNQRYNLGSGLSAHYKAMLDDLGYTTITEGLVNFAIFPIRLLIWSFVCVSNLCICSCMQCVKLVKFTANPKRRYLGFFIGTILTICTYLFTVLQMQYSPSSAFIQAAIFGIPLTMGICMFKQVRCFALLLIPTLFTSRIRTLMIIYAVFLVTNGPVTNFRDNVEVLSELSTCNAQLLGNTSQNVLRLIKDPAQEIRRSLAEISDAAKQVVTQIYERTKVMKRWAEQTLAGLRRALGWLESVHLSCTADADLAKRCDQIALDLKKDCDIKLGVASACGPCSGFPLSCSIKSLWCKPGGQVCVVARDAFHGVCSTAVQGSGFALSKLCGGLDKLLNVFFKVASQADFNQIRKDFNDILDKLRGQFDFSVNISAEYDYFTNETKSLSDIAENIHQELVDTLYWILRIVNTIGLLSVLLIFATCFSTWNYQRKYRGNDLYDNIYLNEMHIQMDKNRLNRGLSNTILPLRWFEIDMFLFPWSPLLTASEKSRAKMAIIILLPSCAYIIGCLMGDLIFYGVLTLVKEVLETLKLTLLMGLDAKSRPVVNGTGFLATFYQTLLNSIDPTGGNRQGVANDLPCQPKPLEPDWLIYSVIGIMLFFAVFSCFFQSFGLRLRHLVCDYFYPDRMKQRSLFMYNFVLARRAVFSGLTKSLLKIYVVRDKQARKEKIPLRDIVFFKCPTIGKIMTLCGYKRQICQSCGVSGPEGDLKKFTPCPNVYFCKSLYCIDCWRAQKRTCGTCNTAELAVALPSIYREVDFNDVVEYDSGMSSDEDDRKGVLVSGRRSNLGAMQPRRKNVNTSSSMPAYTPRTSSFDDDYDDTQFVSYSSSLTGAGPGVLIYEIETDVETVDINPVISGHIKRV